jgi:hypothetical protein
VTATQSRRWTAVPAARSRAGSLKVKLFVVLGLAGLAALAGPATAVFVLTRPAPAPVVIGGNATADGYARTVAEDYLNARPTSVPVADNVDASFGRTATAKDRKPLPYDGLTLVASQATPADPKTKSPEYNISKFLFEVTAEDGTRKAMKIDVTMLVTADGPVLAAEPTLRAADLTADKYQPLDYQEVASYKEGSPSAAVSDLVAEWAKAFATGDSHRLGELVRDPDGGTYQGLGGFTSSRTPEIRSYVVESPVNVQTVHGVKPHNPIYVRARVWFQSTGAEKFESSADYDLLIFDAKSDSPYVVAWGAPGSAPLTPFTENSNRH